MPVNWGIVANTGGLVNQPVLTTATVVMDINTAGAKTLTVMWRLRATTTTTDLNTPGIKPYLPDGVTLVGVNLTGFQAPTSTAANPDTWATGCFDLRGVQKVRAQFTNNNVGTLNYDLLYTLL